MKAFATTLRILALAALPAVYSMAAFAAEEVEGEHGGGGLPQFDPSSYPSQVFWLLVTFGILYAFFGTKILPALSSILENRRNHIQGALEMAEKLKAEADLAQQNYEKLLESSHAESSRLMTGAEHAIKTKSEHALSSLREKSAREIEAMDSRLKTEKTRAKKQMNDIAAEIASEAAARIVGIKADLKQAQTVVESLNRKEAA